MTSAPAVTQVPRAVRWSVRCWLAAVAAGVLETAIHALTRDDYNAAVELPVRAVIYVVAIVLITQLSRGQCWARIVLTVLLGVVGLLSLLAEPISWLAAGGSPAAFLTAADTPTRAVVAVRAAHVVAVLLALILMYRPTANRFFRRVVRGQV